MRIIKIGIISLLFVALTMSGNAQRPLVRHEIQPLRHPDPYRSRTLNKAMLESTDSFHLKSKAAQRVGDFHVELLTPVIEAAIGTREGKYVIDAPLCLRISTSTPGWRMNIFSTELSLDEKKRKDTIRPEEVRWITEDAESIPLHRPQSVIQRGKSGLTPVSVNLGMVTTKLHRPGTYRGNLLVELHHPTLPYSPPIRIPFTIMLGSRVEHSIKDNKVYFHIGNPTEQMNASVRGWVKADGKLQLNLSTEEGRIDSIPSTKTPGSNHPSSESPIPLEWSLREGSVATFRKPDAQSVDGKNVSWILEGTPGETEYELNLDLKTAPYIAPGDYKVRFVVTLAPAL